MSEGHPRVSRRTWIIIAILAMLAYPVYYLASPLFIATHVNETLPNFTLTTVLQGSFRNGAPGHMAQGSVILYRTLSGGQFVRFENFSVTNGPDLNVYLSKGQNPGLGYVNLGDLKGSQGDQNYDLPRDIDLNEYSFVLVWCVSFSVLFGYASLT